MHTLVDGWTTAKAVNGDVIRVNVIPLTKVQSNLNGFSQVEVSKQIELESGQILNLNLDKKSFYTAINQLYKLLH